MGRFLFNIVDTFWLERVGLVVASDARAVDVSLRVGEPIELRRPDGSRLLTEVAAIAHVSPYRPDRSFDFSLPRGVQKEDVPAGTQVWTPS